MPQLFRRGSEPFVALPPRRIPERCFAITILRCATQCHCKSNLLDSLAVLCLSAACQSKACVTTPLPIVSSVCFAAANPCFASPLPRQAHPLHRLTLRFPCKHSVSMPPRSQPILCLCLAVHFAAAPLRIAAYLYSAVATHCIPMPLPTLRCTTKPLLCGTVNATPLRLIALLCYSVALPFHARPRVSMPLPVIARPSSALAFTRALRR